MPSKKLAAIDKTRCVACGVCENTCPLAVSYTHLDVYKRQVEHIYLHSGGGLIDPPRPAGCLPQRKDCLLYTSRCV